MTPKSFNDLLARLEELAPGTSAQVGEEIARLENLLETFKAESARTKARVADGVQKNPWAALGIVGIIFFILGLNLGRKGKK